VVNVIERNINGNRVFIDADAHLKRIVDAIGPGVIKYEAKSSDFQANGGTASDPNGWTATVVEVGAGTSEAQASRDAGYAFELVTAGNENDGISLQMNGEVFELTSDQVLVFGMRGRSE
jgi:hypothetical protein